MRPRRGCLRLGLEGASKSLRFGVFVYGCPRCPSWNITGKAPNLRKWPTQRATPDLDSGPATCQGISKSKHILTSKRLLLRAILHVLANWQTRGDNHHPMQPTQLKESEVKRPMPTTPMRWLKGAGKGPPMVNA